MSEFTKTVPTEPGDYWWRWFIDDPKSKVKSVHVFGDKGQLLVVSTRGVVDVHNYGGFWGPRITFPSVPDEVLKASRWLRTQLETSIQPISLSHGVVNTLTTLIDFIDHISPRPEPLATNIVECANGRFGIEAPTGQIHLYDSKRDCFDRYASEQCIQHTRIIKRTKWTGATP